MNNVNKPTATETGVAAITLFVAADLGYELATHNVPIPAIVATILFALAGGLSIAARLGTAARTSVFTCPNSGCTVTIRASGTRALELDKLRHLATDHTQH